jgi:hypothetical protein
VAELLRTQSSRNAPTLRIAAAGAEIAYCEFGPPLRCTGGVWLPNASVTLYPESGHGVPVQNHHAFVDATRDFLRR